VSDVRTTVDPAAPVLEHRGRVLDWRPRFDPRSLTHRVAATATTLPTTGRLWPHTWVGDQGREGACVAFACCGEAAAEPAVVPGITDRVAQAYYRRAQQLDEWPGTSYDGTSVLAGCKTGRERGWWTGYRWAKSAEELAAGIVAAESDGGGPGIIGVEWREGSYETDALGILRPAGDVVGGHALAVLAWVPALSRISAALRRQLEERDLWAGVTALGGRCFVILNSWGPSFGKRGLCLVGVDVMRAWIRAGAELAVPVGRAVPKATTASPEQPATAGADRTHHLSALELRDGDRVVDRVPAAQLGQETATVTGRPRVVAGAGGDWVLVESTAGGFRLRASEAVTVRRSVA